MLQLASSVQVARGGPAALPAASKALGELGGMHSWRRTLAVAMVIAAVLIPFSGPARAGSDGLTPAQEQLAKSSIPKVVVMDPVTGKILSIQLISIIVRSPLLPDTQVGFGRLLVSGMSFSDY